MESLISGSSEVSERIPDFAGPDVIQPHVLVDDLVPEHLGQGVIIPLKTTLEIRQDHTVVQAYITRVPTKAANDFITYVPFHPHMSSISS